MRQVIKCLPMVCYLLIPFKFLFCSGIAPAASQPFPIPDAFPPAPPAGVTPYHGIAHHYVTRNPYAQHYVTGNPYEEDYGYAATVWNPFFT